MTKYTYDDIDGLLLKFGINGLVWSFKDNCDDPWKIQHDYSSSFFDTAPEPECLDDDVICACLEATSLDSDLFHVLVMSKLGIVSALMASLEYNE